MDELKVNNPESSKPDEICDIYIRQYKRIAIGEIKSTSFKNEFKYATNVVDTFKENKYRFIKDFGLLQIIKGIKYLLNYPFLLDSAISTKSQYKIFPIIVLNERLYQVPFADMVFQKLFLELFSEQIGSFNKPRYTHSSFQYKNLIIYPITLLHTTDIEILEPHLSSKKINFWDILKEHFRMGLLHAPFYYTLHRHISKDIITHAMEKAIPILEEYDRRLKKANA